ncbi:MAG: oligosaccharide flippase family protein [Cyanomargarita calcarea GSE-NOS-MK-12-04C]|jgi:O-antigen/teichoic acid export membrane protein|uniref:Oligosaccharide flippase family protein n=1 Tax=Cyanomargarita calcarea GSE-NOS-MK-12-04C TaxID=2839659 RepID=A0A951QHG4_9CYAN|nr:oligosaccharide flippase family protein [Cyanomargarita calcarea GSE-NOS-MK-12-04C]
MRLINNFFQNGSIDEKGKKRVRQAGLTGIITLAVRGITTIAGLFSIPITSQYLGPERFGIWLIISTFLTWVSAADFGLANSLTNALATADGQEDRKAAKEAVSSTFWLMVGTSLVLLVIFLITHPYIAWERVFNVNSETAKADVSLATFICFILFILRLPLSIPGRIYGAYQEGYFYQLWVGLSSIISVVTLILAIYLHASLPVLITAFFGTLLLGDLFSAIHLFSFHKQWLRPDIKYFSWLKSKYLFKIGFQFWIAQISAVLIFQTDIIIVSQLFGVIEVASYGVTFRLFTIIGLIQSAFIIPLWPAYVEASSKNDFSWIIKIFKKSVYLSLFWSLSAGTTLVIVSPQIVSSLVSQDAIPQQNLLFAMLFTCVLTSIAQCVAMLVNGLGEIKLQAFVAPISAICNLLLSVILGNLIGVSGVAWATGICVLLFSLLAVGGDILKKLKTRSKTGKLIGDIK